MLRKLIRIPIQSSAYDDAFKNEAPRSKLRGIQAKANKT